MSFINDGGDDNDVLDDPTIHVQLPPVVVVHKQQEQVDNILQEQVVLLQAVHKLGVINSDIKPNKILLSNYGPKLIDFGISFSSDAKAIQSSAHEFLRCHPSNLVQLESRKISSHDLQEQHLHQ